MVRRWTKPWFSSDDLGSALSGTRSHRFFSPGFRPPWAGIPQGPLVAPGIYSVELYVLHNGKLQTQGGVQEFIVKPIPALEGRDFEETFAFHKELNDLSREMNSAGSSLGEASTAFAT